MLAGIWAKPMKFHFEAMERDGRLVTGLIEAPSERSAHRDLLKRGVRPTAIGIAADPGSGAARRGGRSLRRRDYASVLKQMHVLIAGGVPIAEAVTALADATGHAALSAAYGELNARLRRGDPLPQAFAECFPGIPAHIHRLVAAGDMTGRLAEALADAAAELEHEARIRTELRQALVYPAFLVGFGFFAIVFIFSVVVPRFAVMFEGKLDRLPLLSYLVIATGMWFRTHVLIASALLASIAAVGAYAVVRPQSREALIRAVARLPLLRAWRRDVEIARWAGVLARLLDNRVPLVQSLELARTALRGGALQLQLAQAERDIRAGKALAAALEASAFLGSTALTLIRVGERSGNLAEMVRSIASIYDEAVRNRTRVLLSIIEPSAIIVIGGVIGLIAMAIFQAITSINKVPGL